MNKLSSGKISYKKVFSIVIIFSFIAWLIGIIINPESWQREVFFSDMEDFLADASYTTGIAHKLNPYLDNTIGLHNAAYPPLAYALFYLLSRAAGSVPENYLDYYHNPMWLFLFITVIAVSFILIYTLAIKRFGGTADTDNILAGIALCVSYPIIHTIERGNIIILVLVALMVYLFYYDSKSKVKKELALICLAFAAGIKMTPAIFGILLIYKKDWKASIRTVIYGILAFIIPFFFFEGGIENLAHFINNVRLHSKYAYMDNGTTLQDIFMFWYCRAVILFTGKSVTISTAMHLFFTVVKVVLSALFIVSGFLTKDSFKRILNITLTLLILPSVSQNYCIIYLLPCVIIFLSENKLGKKHNIWEALIMTAFILMNFVFRFPYANWLNFKNISLLILIFVASVYSFSVIKKYIKEKKNRMESVENE